MIWAFKMFFKIIGWTFAICFAFALFPFFIIYALLGGKPKQTKRKAQKRDDLSWIDRMEDYDALFHE